MTGGRRGGGLIGADGPLVRRTVGRSVRDAATQGERRREETGEQLSLHHDLGVAPPPENAESLGLRHEAPHARRDAGKRVLGSRSPRRVRPRRSVVPWQITARNSQAVPYGTDRGKTRM
ncbi:hypothetical protein A7982_12588 [Minicystis rosea]|nr:hypothetical protein A7982_12588 [Minicystis rosea]